ncbi:MAG: protein-disulfide reductase DsbD family protein, partial [Flavobacteriales bacterium]
GYAITAIFGAGAFNALSTNVWFNLLFFALFTVFAISFFGAFDLTLPSSWTNKTEEFSDKKGGMIGIFFMAFTLTLVSFSCTAPIMGLILFNTAVIGGILKPVIGMLGFSTALALPFTIFAIIPSWLNSMPQSGGWMNTVKVTLGFLELAFALKFLSNADLVTQAGYLKRELFVAIWIAIFGLLTLYLLGFIRMFGDSEIKTLSVPRLLFAMLSLVFTLYLIPGLWGAPLKLVKGFPPPRHYSESGITSQLSGNSVNYNDKTASNKHNKNCPLGLKCFHDYEKGMKYAKKVNKPVMLDFTGWACVNCRKMEENVWSQPKVKKKIREDVVLISLYVDAKKELPPEEQKTVKIKGREMDIETVGDKWMHFQMKRYEQNSQPFYVLLDHNGNKLNEPIAYTNVNKFNKWLKEGISNF